MMVLNTGWKQRHSPVFYCVTLTCNNQKREQVEISIAAECHYTKDISFHTD